MAEYAVRLCHVHHGTRKHGRHWGAAGMKAARPVGDEVRFEKAEEAEAFVRRRDLIEDWPGARCRDKGHYIAVVNGPDGAASHWEEGERVDAPAS